MLNNNVPKILSPELPLEQIQAYMRAMVQDRGFTEETVSETMLLLLEEVGELAKAIRKSTGLKIDQNRLQAYGNLKHELADVLIYVFVLANKCNVNLFEALYEKEQINSKRVWQAKKEELTLSL